MYSLNIPNDLNYIINKIVKIPYNELSNVVNLILHSMNQNNYQQINLQALSNKVSLNLQETEDFFGILLILIRWCQQLRFNSDKEIKNYIIEQGFSAEWTNNFFNLVAKKDDKIVRYCSYMMQMDKLNWRIDISLYNNTLQKSVSPTIIWAITLKNGKKYIIEISIKKFHEIRYNISTLLKELNIVQQNSLVKK